MQQTLADAVEEHVPAADVVMRTDPMDGVTLYAQQAPKTEYEWTEVLREYSNDCARILETSPAWKATLNRHPELRKNRVDLLRTFHNWIKDRESELFCCALMNVAIQRNVVQERALATASTRDERRWVGFEGGVSVVGITGGGLAVVVGERYPVKAGTAHAHPDPRIYVMNVAGAELARTEVMHLDASLPAQVRHEAKEGNTAVVADISKVSPCYIEVEGVRLRAQPELSAVARQHNSNLIAFVTFTHDDEYNGGALELVNPRAEEEAARRIECPLAPQLVGACPNAICVSSDYVVLMCLEKKGYALPDTQTLRTFPPHLFVARVPVRSATDWKVFVPALPPLPAKLVEEGVPHISCIEFDEIEPNQLWIGTGDGACLRYTIHEGATVSEEGAPPVLNLASDANALYLTPTLTQDLMAARASPSPEEALLEVGSLRRPVWSIHSLGSRADAQNATERSTLVCATENGLAWLKGRLSRDAVVNALAAGRTALRTITTNETAVCVRSLGNVLVVHNTLGKISFVNTATGKRCWDFSESEVEGSIGQIAARPYHSLYLDVGRAVVLYPNGFVGFVQACTPEMLSAVEEAKRNRSALLAKPPAARPAPPPVDERDVDNVASRFSSLKVAQQGDSSNSAMTDVPGDV